jgi:hypothetical protein
MALVPTFPADVTPDGKLELPTTARRDLARYVKTLKGKRVRVSVAEAKDTRSTAANRWWWGVAVPLIANELGYDRHEHERVHYALVAKAFGVTIDPKLKTEVPNVRSSKLTTEQFSELMEWAVRFAATELGIVVPLPGETLSCR